MKRLAILAAAMLLPCLVACAQQKQWAVVERSSIFLRNAPDYEAALDTQSLMGTVVQVLPERDRYWVKVSTPDPYTDWTTEMNLAFMTEAEKDAYIAAPKWICIAEYSHIFSAPDAGADRLGDFTMGNLVRQTGVSEGSWVKVLLPSGREGWVPAADVADFREWIDSRTLTQESLVAFAKKFVGVPYMWGGISVKHFDCSGLCKFTYMMHGVLLMRDSSQQIKTGVEVPFDFSLMQPGDLVFFGRKASGDRPRKPSHVALYIGDGRIIHSSMTVRINSLRKGEPDYYEKEVIGVRRILGHVDTGEGIVSTARSPWYFKQ